MSETTPAATFRQRALLPSDPNIPLLESRAKARASRRAFNKTEAERIKNEVGWLSNFVKIFDQKCSFQGNDAFRTADYPLALMKYDKALSVGGANPIILCNLAATYLKMGM